MSATNYWRPDGKPVSATEFVERLFGELPKLLKDEDKLRQNWGLPNTRRMLLEQLAERGYGETQLEEIKSMINAEKSDLFDVLAYLAFSSAPITRAERDKWGKADFQRIQ